MWFENLLVFILFKFKKCPNISGIQVVNTVYICMSENMYEWEHKKEWRSNSYTAYTVKLIFFLKFNIE